MQLVTSKFTGKPDVQASGNVPQKTNKSGKMYLRFALPLGIVAAFGAMIALLMPRVAADNGTIDLSFLWSLMDSLDAGIPHMSTLLNDGFPFGIKLVILLCIVGAFWAAYEYVKKKL
jgi:hypothetical protein